MFFPVISGAYPYGVDRHKDFLTNSRGPGRVFREEVDVLGMLVRLGSRSLRGLHGLAKVHKPTAKIVPSMLAIDSCRVGLDVGFGDAQEFLADLVGVLVEEAVKHDHVRTVGIALDILVLIVVYPLTDLL